MAANEESESNEVTFVSGSGDPGAETPQRERLIRAHLEEIARSKTFSNRQAPLNLLLYLRKHAERFLHLTPAEREVEIMRENYGKKPKDRHDVSVARTGFDHLDEALAEFYQTEAPSSNVVIRLPRGDFKFLLQYVISAPAPTIAEVAPRSSPLPIPEPTTVEAPLRATPESNRRRKTLIIAAIIFGAIIALVWLIKRPGTRARIRVLSGASVILASEEKGIELMPAISPGADRIVYSLRQGGSPTRLYERTADGEGVFQLTFSDGDDVSPVWSPDGRKIAFMRLKGTKGKIYAIPALGGRERPLMDVNSIRPEVPGRQLAWSTDGNFLVFVDRYEKNFALYTLDLKHYNPSVLLKAEPNTIGYSYPVFSPDGTRLAFLSTRSMNVRDVKILTFAKKQVHELLLPEHTNISGLTWTPDGDALIVAMQVKGTSQLVGVFVDGSGSITIQGFGEGALYPDMRGNLLVFTNSAVNTDLFSGKLQIHANEVQETRPLITSDRQDTSPQFSPNGQLIAFASDRAGPYEIYVAKSDGSDQVKITSIHEAGSPRWSPDGKRIAFDSRVSKTSQIYIVNSDGNGPTDQLTFTGVEHSVPSWSADGRSIYYGSKDGGDMQIWRIGADGKNAQQVTQHGGFAPLPSRDGRYVYYVRDRSDVRGLYRLELASRTEELVIAEFLPNYWPYWALALDGIFYLDSDAVSMLSGDVATVATPTMVKFYSLSHHALMHTWRLNGIIGAYYSGLAVSPDGARMIYPNITTSTSKIMIVDPVHTAYSR